MRIFLTLLFITISLYGGSKFSDAKQAYLEQDYERAYKLFSEVENSGSDADAAYYLAFMYENGYGVPKDQVMADKWYKISAGRYHNISIDNTYSEVNKVRRKFYRPIDKNDFTTLNAVSTGKFGFKAYETNYLLPFSYRLNNSYPETKDNIKAQQAEIEYQVSLQMDVGHNLLGFDELYSFGYTQHSFWQAYADSAYFRANVYNPQVFVTFPMAEKSDIGLNYIRFALQHQSNGEGAYEERAWNFVSSDFLFQYGSLFAELRFWYRIPSGDQYPAGHDYNPNLIDYLGYGHINFTHVDGDHLTRLLLRYNPYKDYGAIELSYSYPIYKTEDIFWFIKGFHGYGESLNSYDKEITKVALGLSFSRSFKHN
jgi:phospholipase A1/A2